MGYESALPVKGEEGGAGSERSQMPGWFPLLNTEAACFPELYQL